MPGGHHKPSNAYDSREPELSLRSIGAAGPSMIVVLTTFGHTNFVLDMGSSGSSGEQTHLFLFFLLAMTVAGAVCGGIDAGSRYT